MNKLNLLFSLCLILSFAVSCSNDDDAPCELSTFYEDADGDGLGNPAVSLQDCQAPEGYVANANDDNDQMAAPYVNGYFVINEGIFGQSTAEVTFVSADFSSVQQDVFSHVNPSLDVGDVLQSGFINGQSIYLVVNNSDKIEVVNRYTFEHQATISGFDSPRYMAVYENKGFVTSWGSSFDGSTNTLYVVDLTTHEITNTISATASGVIERVYTINDKIVVLVNGFGAGTQLMVYNPETEALEATIEVGEAPHSAVVYNEEFYVLCAGQVGSDFQTPVVDAEIWRVDTDALSANKVFDWEQATPQVVENARDLAVYNNQLVVQVVDAELQAPGIYTLGTGDFSQATLLFETNGFFYGFSVQNNQIFGSGGTVSATTNVLDGQGNVLNTIPVGDFPTQVIYNQ